MEALLIKDEKPIINILANDFYSMLEMFCAVYMCKFVFMSFYMCMHTQIRLSQCNNFMILCYNNNLIKMLCTKQKSDDD